VVLLANGGIVEHTAATAFFQAPVTATAKRFLAGELIL
jgi:ABC-type phosphate transport system ATPase subunit